jgi:hypothetical protein
VALVDLVTVREQMPPLVEAGGERAIVRRGAQVQEGVSKAALAFIR